ncbi:hypothetical protein Ac2012v2_003630 [Leucoagaricus gongylophorus]
MIHVDLNHPSTSPLKSSASAAVLDSFTWDVGGDDPFDPTSSCASVMGPDDSTLVHTQEFGPEEFLNDDLENVIHLPPDVGAVGMDPLGVTSAVTSSIQTTHARALSNISLSSSSAGDSGLPPYSSTTDNTFLASPDMGEVDRSSSLSPVPETNSPSGQGESGPAGDGVEHKGLGARPEQVSREKEEEEEDEEEQAAGMSKVEMSRQSSPLSPLTPPADELDGEGEGESDEKKEGEKKVGGNLVAVRSVKSLPPQKQQLHALQHPQKKQVKGRQTTKSPSRTVGTAIPFNNASMQHPQQLRQLSDTSAFGPIAHSNNITRDPKVVKVLDLNAELLNVFSQFQSHGISNNDPRFVQYATCLKTNLSWLAAAADGHPTALPNMDPPPMLEFASTDRIRQLYAELPNLFTQEIVRVKAMRQQQQQRHNALKRDRAEDHMQMTISKRRDTGEGKGLMAPPVPPTATVNGINSTTGAVSGGTPVNGTTSGSSTPNSKSGGATGNSNGNTNNSGAGVNVGVDVGHGGPSNSSTPTSALGNSNSGPGVGPQMPNPGGEGMGMHGSMGGGGMAPEQHLRTRQAQLQARAQMQVAAARQMSPPNTNPGNPGAMGSSPGLGGPGGMGGPNGGPMSQVMATMFQMLQQPSHPFVQYMVRNVPGFQQMPPQMQVQKMIVAQQTLHARQEQQQRQQVQQNQMQATLQARVAGGGNGPGTMGGAIGGAVSAGGFCAPGSPVVQQGGGGMMGQSMGGGNIGMGGAGAGGMSGVGGMDPRMIVAARAGMGMDMSQQRQLMLLQQQQRAMTGTGGGPGGLSGPEPGHGGLGGLTSQQMAMQQERLLRQQQAGNMVSPSHGSPVGGGPGGMGGMGGMGMGGTGGMGRDMFVPPSTLRSNAGTIPGIARSTRSPSDGGATSPVTPRVPSRSLSSGPMGMGGLGGGVGAISGTEEYQRLMLQQQQNQATRLMHQNQQQGGGSGNSGGGQQSPVFNGQGMSWGGAGGAGPGGSGGGPGAGAGFSMGDAARQMSATPNPAAQGMSGMGSGMGMGNMGMGGIGSGMGSVGGGMGGAVGGGVSGMGGGMGGMGGGMGGGGIGMSGMGGMSDQGLGSSEYDFLGSTNCRPYLL